MVSVSSEPRRPLSINSCGRSPGPAAYWLPMLKNTTISARFMRISSVGRCRGKVKLSQQLHQVADGAVVEALAQLPRLHDRQDKRPLSIVGQAGSVDSWPWWRSGLQDDSDARKWPPGAV